jgi:hypothetical protein
MGHVAILSYLTTNKDAADATCEALEERGISVWMAPRDAVTGRSWPGEPFRQSTTRGR